jgi:hypothetical protein
MTTYYVVNEILTWEQVCTRQGKKSDSTMPTYLKMAMQDIDSKAAEGFGLDSAKREVEHRMRSSPMLPKKCEDCSTTNRSIHDICSRCGAELEDAKMPKSELAISETKQENQQSKKMLQKMAEEMDMTVEEFFDKFSD